MIDVTITFDEERLAKAKTEFPSTYPDHDPLEWVEGDLIRVLASLYHRDFEIVSITVHKDD